ncbi:ankyrin-3-like isoform X2 [Zophobas morio]|uniref:ankyrin-3-like isoform X2 n=1 Tax=Zophobas morio TaxID=2755281 RepID=UPI00308386F6
MEKYCVQEIDSLKRKLKNCRIHNIEDYLNESNTSTERSETAESGTSRISVFITTNACQKMQFEAICDKNKDLKNYHHLRFIDADNFEWIQSKCNVSSLEEYKITDFILTEKEMLCTKLENNINLIVSNPGMGKSELMKSLKNTSPPEIWTIMMNPTDMCLFSKYLTSNNQSANLETLQNFLLYEKYRCMDEGAKHFLQVFIKQNQVYYIWDALDEIPAESVETITSLIVELSKANHVQWITSRFQLKHLLENKFNVLSTNLCQFSEQEQITYIKKRLENVDTTEEVDQIISTVRSSFVLVEHTEILGIPLQIFMLTNLLRQDINKYFKLLCNIFILTDLYHYFVEEKMKLYFEKTVGGDFKNSLYESAIKILETAILNYHQNLALRTLFSVEFLKKLNFDIENNVEDSKEEFISVGLLTKIISKPANFIHNSFAEYFAALYFSQNQRLSSIFVDVIFEPRYVNVRFFFDLLLAKESPPHVAVLYKNINLLEKYEHQIGSGTDAGDRSVLHVASSWGQRHPRLDVTTTADAYIVDDSGVPNVEAEKTEDLNILNYLLNTCDLSQCDMLFKMTPLLYARKSNSLVIEFKILKQLKKKLLDLPVEHIINLLYYTAVCGYDDVIDHLNLEVSNFSSRQDAELLKLEKKVLDARNIVNKTLLHLASARQFEKVVKFLVIQGTSIEASDTEGATALYFASQGGYYKIVEFLVTAGAEINREKVNGVTALFVASQYGHIKVVECLLGLGADPNQQRDIGATPLHVACEFGHDEIVELLVTSGAEINLARLDGVTPLYTASHCGQIKIVKRLLALGANVNQSTDIGATPLHIACEYGHEEIIVYLVMSGAEINRGRKDGVTPLFTATQFGETKIARRLLALGADPNQQRDIGATPLHVASEFGHEEIIECLVTSGAAINCERLDGITPLFTACQFGQTKIAGRLLALGADPNQQRDIGATSLHVACEFGHEEIVKLLVTSGAEINLARLDGVTPLYTASYCGQIKVVECLLALGANINQSRDTGATPLHIACEFGHEEIIEILVASGAEINRSRVDDVTPFFVACEFGHIKVVERLLALGAHINQADNTGVTPLYIACEKGYENVVEILVASGADINLVTCFDRSPLSVALEKKHDKIVQILKGWINSGKMKSN